MGKEFMENKAKDLLLKLIIGFIVSSFCALFLNIFLDMITKITIESIYAAIVATAIFIVTLVPIYWVGDLTVSLYKAIREE